jgi:hypothetical protein
MEDKKLSKEQFLAMKASVTAMRLADERLQSGYLKLELMNRDLEIARLKAALFKHSLSGLDGQKQLAKEEYEALKKSVGEAIGVDLEGKVIDEITYEVRSLPA